MSDYFSQKDFYGNASMLLNEKFTHPDGFTIFAREEAWFAWDGCKYVELSEVQMDSLFYPWLASKKTRQLDKQKGEWKEIPVVPDDTMVRKSKHAFRAVCSKGEVQDCSYMGSQDFPDPKNIIPFRNGLLDASAYCDGEVKLIPHTPLFFNLNCLDHSFVEEAECPQWLAFLQDIFNGDQGSIDALQEWFGYNLTSDTKQHKMHLWQGEKRGGKGTCSRILEALLGKGNVAWPSLDALGTRFGLESIVGAKAVIFPDAGLGRWCDGKQVSNIIKSITGEDCLSVDRKNKPVLGSIKFHCKITMLVNETPKLPDASNALSTRLIFVNFPNSYLGREDKTLEDRLMTELPGITLWALEGLKRLRKNSALTQPEAGNAIREEFEEGSSNTLAFMRDCCVIGEGKKIDIEIMYKRYRGWCEESGLKNPLDVRHFGIQLRAINGQIQRKRHTSGDRKWYYDGIDLTATDKEYVTKGLAVINVVQSDHDFVMDMLRKKRSGRKAS